MSRMKTTFLVKFLVHFLRRRISIHFARQHPAERDDGYKRHTAVSVHASCDKMLHIHTIQGPVTQMMEAQTGPGGRQPALVQANYLMS